MALYYYQKQLNLACKIKDRTIEAQTYDYMGIEYYYLGDIEKSVYYHNLSMDWGTTSRFSLSSVGDMVQSIRNCINTSEAPQDAGHNYENNCANKMSYLKSKNFAAFLTQTKMIEIKKRIRESPLPLTSVPTPARSFFTPEPGNYATDANSSSLPREKKRTRTVSKLDMILRPYKLKMQNIKRMLEQPKKDAQGTVIVAKHAESQRLNFNNYSHMSSLRNTRNVFSIKATSERLSVRLQEFKQLAVQCALGIIKNRGIFECYEETVREARTEAQVVHSPK